MRLHVPAFFRLRDKSLTRGTLLVLASLPIALSLAGFPELKPAPAIALPLLIAIWGSCETVRCLRLRWSLYHMSVLLLLYMDVMALSMLLFLLIYPYGQWIR